MNNNNINTNARTRLLCLVEIMTMYSDEQHILSIEEICDWLHDYGYAASKRNILADIKAINTTPIKIISVSKPKKGFYIAKYFSQDAIRLILESVFASDLLTEKDVEYIKKYLHRFTCIPTLDLILNTTINLNSLSPKRKVSGEAVHNLRLAIRDKKQAEITVHRAVPGDTFSETRKTETLTVNPIVLAVNNKSVSLVFTNINSPKKAEFVNTHRIESVKLLNSESTEFADDLTGAVNYFDSRSLSTNKTAKDWIFIRFKAEDVELVENRFNSPIQLRKDDSEGYYVAKVFTPIDDSLIGWLFTLSDKIEIIAPSSLKELFEKKAKNI